MVLWSSVVLKWFRFKIVVPFGRFVLGFRGLNQGLRVQGRVLRLALEV